MTEEEQQTPVDLNNNDPAHRVLLVGAGVVGRAIAVDHLRSGIEVWIADQDESTLRRSCDLVLRESDAVANSASPWGARIPIPVVHFSPPAEASPSSFEDDEFRRLASGTEPVPRWLLIESIAERLEIKQAFFAEAERWFEREAVLTTNTSTLPIASIAAKLRSPRSLCGLHFFMPVSQRPAAEIIPHHCVNSSTGKSVGTHDEVIRACCEHAVRLGKSPLQVRDAPGFVVNRLLAPYLNLATDLLCGGIDAESIRQGALRYGMPISPFELIDLIGTRTAFDGGRIVWSAFPNRMDPSPLLPALVKRKLAGVASGEGFYQYDNEGNRQSDQITPTVTALASKYRHESFVNFPTESVHRIDLLAELFAAVIQLEATAIERDGVADAATVASAIRGGLGWNATARWSRPVDVISSERIKELAERFENLKSIQPLS
ncbi:MAG: 3-hydroxyacyl-CoA dehydrogenase family protein [Rhodopirellula sp. JB044]|uniref:3-hydroxyacyl-CoA dehydrogenase family protein n=1 Tax=Rhodopirellula sp. JB044 TaxID=3342844 RepID=UPI00370CA363